MEGEEREEGRMGGVKQPLESQYLQLLQSAGMSETGAEGKHRAFAVCDQGSRRMYV